MKPTLKSFLFLLVVLLYFSCQKDVTFKPLPYENQLSIECILTPGQVPHLFLSNSVPFFNSLATPQALFARGASVTISGPAGNDILLPDSTFDYFRCRWVPFYKGAILPQLNQSYTLTVVYEGKTYSATTTISQPKIQIQSTDYIQEFHDIYGGHEGVIVNFTDAPGPGNYYRYQMNRMIDSSVYATAKLDVIRSTCTNGMEFLMKEIGRSVYSDKNLDGQAIKFVIEPAFEHQQDDTAWVFVQSLDKNAAEFYESLDKQKLAQFNPFVEPVFLKSHIPGCLGVFGSMVVSDSVLFVFPE